MTRACLLAGLRLQCGAAALITVAVSDRDILLSCMQWSDHLSSWCSLLRSVVTKQSDGYVYREHGDELLIGSTVCKYVYATSICRQVAVHIHACLLNPVQAVSANAPCGHMTGLTHVQDARMHAAMQRVVANAVSLEHCHTHAIIGTANQI